MVNVETAKNSSQDFHDLQRKWKMLYPSNHSYEQFGTFCHQYNGNDRVSFEDQKVTSGIFEDLNFRARNVFHSSGALSHCSVYTPNEQSLQEKYTENSGFSDCSDEQENWRNSCNRATWAYKSFSNPNFHKTNTQGQTQETVEHAEVTSNGFQNSLEHIEHNQWSEGTTIGDHHRRHYQEQCNADTRDTRIKDHLGRHNHGSFPSTNVTWANFGVSRDIGTRDGYFEAVSDDHCRFRHFRADHLSEIQFENSVPHAPSQWKSFSGIVPHYFLLHLRFSRHF